MSWVFTHVVLLYWGGSGPRQIYPKLGKYYLEDKKLPKFHRFGALCFEFHALMLFQYIWNSSCFLPSFFFFSLFYQPKEIHSLFYSNGRKHALMWVHKSHIQRSSYHQINFVEDLSRWVNSNVLTITIPNWIVLNGGLFKYTLFFLNIMIASPNLPAYSILLGFSIGSKQCNCFNKFPDLHPLNLIADELIRCLHVDLKLW